MFLQNRTKTKFLAKCFIRNILNVRNLLWRQQIRKLHKYFRTIAYHTIEVWGRPSDVGAAITVWSLTYILTIVYANALFGIITKCFLIWWTFGDTSHVILTSCVRFFFHILIPHCPQSRICFVILFIKRASSQTKTKYAIKSIESSILRHLLQ